MPTTTTHQYRANYTAHHLGLDISTKWYPTAKEAQDALMRRRGVGDFHYLGDVSGDAHESGGQCEYAPRNGGAVSIECRDI